MLTKYILPGAALLGIIFAVLFVHAGNKPVPATQPVAEPSQAPFDSYVAGAGIVEAASENIAIGTVVPGVVDEVLVKVGDDVKVGQPLFKIDDRDQQADLIVRQAAVGAAKAQASVEEASLADMKNQYDMYFSAAGTGAGAVSKEQLDRTRFAMQTQQAKLSQAQAQVASMEAQLKATQTEIERRIVRAPVAGRALQVKVHPGEFAQAGVLAQPLILLGDVSTLNVRVDVDENDAWRLRPSSNFASRAKAFVRGNRDLSVDLQFVRVEPYVVPKKSLTGDSSERVDTRVLQVLYSFAPSKLPVYVGQQMDVYIEAEQGNH